MSDTQKTAQPEMDQKRDLVSKLCNLEIPDGIKISPNGEHVLYSTSLTWGHQKGKASVSTLWLAKFGESSSSKQITEGTHKDHSLAWHPSKDEFAFISDRAGNGTKSAIYTISLTDTDTAVSVTSTNNEQAIEQFKFSPDGNLIAYISKDEKSDEEKEREEKKEDVQVWRQGERYSRLRVIDLESGTIKILPFDQHVLDLCWIPGTAGTSGGPRIAFNSCRSTNGEDPHWYGTEIHIAPADLNQSEKLCFVRNKAWELTWGSTNLGASQELYFWSMAIIDKNHSGMALYKLDINREPCECERVKLKDDVYVTAVQSVNGNIVVRAQRRLEGCLISVATSDLYACEQEFESHDIVSGVSDETLKLVIVTSDIDHPCEVFSIEGDHKVQLSQHGEILKQQKFGTYTVLTCPTTDDPAIEIDGIYLRPKSNRGDKDSKSGPEKPYPTIVLLHGGPVGRVIHSFNTLYYMWTPYFLSLGYAILLPNYRGSSGRGSEFASFSYGGVGTVEYADTIALTQYAIEKGYADPDRLVVGGYSHGGLASNLCALRSGLHGHGWKFKAAFSGASISDMDTMCLTSDMGYAYSTELNHGGAPWTLSPDDTGARKSSALWAFKEAAERSKREGVAVIPPMLIFHGANDTRVHVSQTWGMRRALEHYSVPFEMVIYPRQGHIFHEQYFWIDLALRIGQWVEKYIGPGEVIFSQRLAVRSKQDV